MIACSTKAYLLMKDFEERWRQEQPRIEIRCLAKCNLSGITGGKEEGISPEKSLTECVGEYFFQVDAMVFFCAVGIAVRSIAPHIRHKSTDPAVVVVDEAGTFSIALLSGHVGGANELAEKIGGFLHALPVITTATDLEHKFAVDIFAEKNRLAITDWEIAKKIAVRILNGERVGILSELCVENPQEIPAELYIEGRVDERRLEKSLERRRSGIWISNRCESELPYEETLQLVPRNVYIGIGCRKGTAEEAIERAVESCLQERQLQDMSVAGAASIDLKKEERGILDYCRRKKIPFQTFDAEQLKKVEGSRTVSKFVEQITGAPNVCESSALASSGGRLICEKKVYDGVTVALAEKEVRVRF